jgi:uncharacterized SAM-binding protein YcdF (DUF218 family)
MTPLRIATRVLGATAVGVLLVAAFTPLPNLALRRLGASPAVERADAIVVLGSGVHAGGELSDASLRRLLHGVALYHRGRAPLLVVSGPANRAGVVEARVRSDMARTLAVPASAIVIVETALTTQEEARDVAVALRSRHVQRVLVVSNRLHLVRSLGVFEEAGFVALAAPSAEISDTDERPEARLQLMRHVAKEVLARVYYRVAGFY